MLKIRLKRVGRKHDPSFRIVVTEKHRGPKSGKYIENLGFYDPRKNIREVKADRVKHWIGVGAQVSDTVHNILVTEKVLDGKKKNVLPKKKPIVKEEKVEKKPAVSPEADESGKEAPKSKEVPAESEALAEVPVEAIAPEVETKEEVPVKPTPELMVEEPKPETPKEEGSKETKDPA